MKSNYYKILNVPYDADSSQIKKAFRALAKKHHPDVSRKMSGDFIRIKEAFEVLSDALKRNRYNRKIGLSNDYDVGYANDRFKVNHIVQDVYDDILDVVADRLHLRRKNNIDIDLYLSESEFADGVEITIAVPQERICPRCFGIGSSVFGSCRKCDGSGRVVNDAVFDLKLTPPLIPGENYVFRDSDKYLRFTLRKKDK